MNDIGKFIKEARKERGLTQLQLAKKAGFGKRKHTISEIENGSNPGWNQLKKILDAMDLNITKHE